VVERGAFLATDDDVGRPLTAFLTPPDGTKAFALADTHTAKARTENTRFIILLLSSCLLMDRSGLVVVSLSYERATMAANNKSDD